MKTTIKTIIAVSALAFTGVFNANAAESNSELISSSENMAQTIDSRKEAQLVTRWFADMAEARATQKIMEQSFTAPAETSTLVANEVETTFEMTDFRAEAQLVTREIADKAEAKATLLVMERGFISPAEVSGRVENAEMSEFRAEAQLLIKLVADNEEAKVTQNVMEKSWTVNEAFSSIENEANYETIDFRTEAQLMTKLVADKEEVKALRKLVTEGKIAENK